MAKSRRTKGLLLCFAGIAVVGVVVYLGAEWVFASFGGALVIFGLGQFGGVVIDENGLRDERLVGGVSVDAANIAGVSADYFEKGPHKIWFPLIETHSGEDIKLTNVATPSQKDAYQRVHNIRDVLSESLTSEVDEYESAEAGSGGLYLPAEEEHAEIEFNMTPGYDAYLREKAQEEATQPTAPQAAPAPESAGPVESSASVDSLPDNVTELRPEGIPSADDSDPLKWIDVA